MNTKEPFKKLVNQGMILGNSAYIFRKTDQTGYVSVELEKKYSSPRSNMVFTLGGMVDRENTTANSNSSTIGSRERREERRPTVTMFSIGGEEGGDDNDDDELTETSGRI